MPRDPEKRDTRPDVNPISLSLSPIHQRIKTVARYLSAAIATASIGSHDQFRRRSIGIVTVVDLWPPPACAICLGYEPLSCVYKHHRVCRTGGDANVSLLFFFLPFPTPVLGLCHFSPLYLPGTCCAASASPSLQTTNLPSNANTTVLETPLWGGN